MAVDSTKRSEPHPAHAERPGDSATRLTRARKRSRVVGEELAEAADQLARVAEAMAQIHSDLAARGGLDADHYRGLAAHVRRVAERVRADAHTYHRRNATH